MSYIKYCNHSIEHLRKMYDYWNSFESLVPQELTFTVAPNRCSDIQETKRHIMGLVYGRLLLVKGLQAFILTRENHANGWAHIHGIGWFLRRQNNAMTLMGGRILGPDLDVASKYKRQVWHYNQLGKVQVDTLRTEQYRTPSGEIYNDWLDYICKDQSIQWKLANLYFGKPVTVDLMLKYEDTFYEE